MIYLIHFDKKFHHAAHYIGFTDNLEKRIDRHTRGDGSKLMRAVKMAGIKYEVVRTWVNGDRNLERKMKNWKNTKVLCPVCSPQDFHKRFKEVV